jgi:hypothetical protein
MFLMPSLFSLHYLSHAGDTGGSHAPANNSHTHLGPSYFLLGFLARPTRLSPLGIVVEAVLTPRRQDPVPATEADIGAERGTSDSTHGERQRSLASGEGEHT